MADGNELLLKMLEQLRADFAADRQERREEAEAARQSRSKTHQRIDELVDRVAKMDTSVALAGEVDAQVRRELDEMKVVLDGVTPSAEEWSRVKRIGKWVGGAILTSGIGLGAAAAALGDQVVTVIRHWLRIT